MVIKNLKEEDSRRVMVDFERARTAKRFIPRRLGGGKNNSRELPIWIEEEINLIKEQYPHLVFKPLEIIEKQQPQMGQQEKKSKKLKRKC
jgi:hypothetical protein